jgi:hypothetical protein
MMPRETPDRLKNRVQHFLQDDELEDSPPEGKNIPGMAAPAGARGFKGLFCPSKFMLGAPSFGPESRAGFAPDSFMPKGWEIKSACA